MMEQLNIPAGMPTLSDGSHDPKEGRACLMEYVSVIAGEPWTDEPACTHFVLARTGQMVNDYLQDEDRHLLVPFIGRLVGTAPHGRELDGTDGSNLFTFSSLLLGAQTLIAPPTRLAQCPPAEWYYAQMVHWIRHYLVEPARYDSPVALIGVLEHALSCHAKAYGHWAPRQITDKMLAQAVQKVTSGAHAG